MFIVIKKATIIPYPKFSPEDGGNMFLRNVDTLFLVKNFLCIKHNSVTYVSCVRKYILILGLCTKLWVASLSILCITWEIDVKNVWSYTSLPHTSLWRGVKLSTRITLLYSCRDSNSVSRSTGSCYVQHIINIFPDHSFSHTSGFTVMYFLQTIRASCISVVTWNLLLFLATAF
jgi:hypothetical protein